MTSTTSGHAAASDARRRPHRSTASGWIYRTVIAGVCAGTLTLTAWAGAQAHAVAQQLDRVTADTSVTTIRQVEHAEQVRADQIETARILDAQRFGNLASMTDGRPSRSELLRMEYAELHRFRTRAPAHALPGLNAEIERLRQAIG